MSDPTPFPPFGTREWARAYLARFDGVRVEVRVTRRPDQPPVRVFALETSPTWDSPTWPQEELLGVLYEVGVSGADHDLTVTESHYERGASGAEQQIVLQLAEQALSGAVGAALTAGIIKLFRSLARRSPPAAPAAALDRGAAVEKARQVVARSYPVEGASLQVVAETRDLEAGSWTVRLIDHDGAAYTVRLGLVDGQPGTASISCEFA